MSTETSFAYPSLDGALLRGTLLRPKVIDPERNPVLFVHGIESDRNEGGLFREIAHVLAEQGVPSLRFDLRAHGTSQGFLPLTLGAGVSDIAASVNQLERELASGDLVPHMVPSLVGASFGGGLCVLYLSLHPGAGLVLLNPNLDYVTNWLHRTDYWEHGWLSQVAVDVLTQKGYLPHGRFKITRSMLNEILHVRPADFMKFLRVSTLTIHGDRDSMVSYDTARDNCGTAGVWKFMTIEGAEHGFIVPGDESRQDPRTHAFREEVVDATVRWLALRSPNSIGQP